MYFRSEFQVMSEEMLGIASDFGLIFFGTMTAGEIFMNKYEIKVDVNEMTDVLKKLDDWLVSYENKNPKQRQFKLDMMEGYTNFQKEVWCALEEVPYGASCSYQDIAKRIGKPHAVQAVGTAIGKNPWLLVVPCHRVLRKSREVGGFSAGVSLKASLLNCEMIDFF